MKTPASCFLFFARLILSVTALLVGLMFALAPQAHAAARLTTLVEFNNNTAPKGAHPYGSLVQGTDGNFYGMTQQGGANGVGTAFKMTPAGVLTTLVEFNDTMAPMGAHPRASLVQGSDGNFYGLTARGGASGAGTAFKMTPTGVLDTLVQFNYNTAPKGRFPFGNLVEGADGSFYGTTYEGGTSDNGTIFKMTPDGVLTTLVEFNNNTAPMGRYPQSSLVLGTDGNFYGLTSLGGVNDNGTAFRMTPDGMLTTLVSFTYNTASTGAYPCGSLVLGSDGNFYGMTVYNGDFSYAIGFGTVFKMTPAGVLTTLVEFNDTMAPMGGYPLGDLVQGTDGNFYGMTYQGGSSSFGTAFKMTSVGVLTTLVSFNDNMVRKGSHPCGSLVQGSDGNLYGMTYQGGSASFGTAFRLDAGPPARRHPAGHHR